MNKKISLLVAPLMVLPLLASCGPKETPWYLNSEYLNGLKAEDVNKDGGVTQTITINGQPHKVRLIGVDHDELADGSGNKAHTTWEFVNYISDSNGYSLSVPWNVKNAETSNAQDYPNSNLRKAIDGGGNGDLMWYEKESPTKSTTYNTSALDMLPKDLKEVLKTVKKETAVSYQFKVTTYDTKLFALSHRETTEKDDTMAANEGETYQFYKGEGDIDANRIKYQVKWHEGAATTWTNITDIKFKDSSLHTWSYAGFNSGYKDEYGGFGWLRSPLNNASSSAWQIGVGGAYLKYSVYQYALPVAPAFCI